MIDSERPTEPSGLEPPTDIERVLSVLESYRHETELYRRAFQAMTVEFQRMAEAHQRTQEAIRQPPWLDAVLNASLGTSAALQTRDEVVALEERVRRLEVGCDARHGDEPLPPLIPPPSGH